MQFVISGPEDTPYSGGLFLFDTFFPPRYPEVAGVAAAGVVADGVAADDVAADDVAGVAADGVVVNSFTRERSY
jgi:hypothetical protein